MLNDLDEVVRQLLADDPTLKNYNLDISFELPNRNWSAGISTPTINCYLFDLHEKRQLREDGWQVSGHGTRQAARDQPPVFFEVAYLITAWTLDVFNEHLLLWDILNALLKRPILNKDPARPLHGALAGYPWPIHASVGQIEGVLKSPGEFWTALENHLKPSLSYVVTLGAERHQMEAGPPVASASARFTRPLAEGFDGTGAAPAGGGRFQIGGTVRDAAGTPQAGVPVALKGHALHATSGPDGRFRLNGLPAGTHTLVATFNGQAHEQTITVTAPDYDITLLP